MFCCLYAIVVSLELHHLASVDLNILFSNCLPNDILSSLFTIGRHLDTIAVPPLIDSAWLDLS